MPFLQHPRDVETKTTTLVNRDPPKQAALPFLAVRSPLMITLHHSTSEDLGMHTSDIRPTACKPLKLVYSATSVFDLSTPTTGDRSAADLKQKFSQPAGTCSEAGYLVIC